MSKFKLKIKSGRVYANRFLRRTDLKGEDLVTLKEQIFANQKVKPYIDPTQTIIIQGHMSEPISTIKIKALDVALNITYSYLSVAGYGHITAQQLYGIVLSKGESREIELTSSHQIRVDTI